MLFRKPTSRQFYYMSAQSISFVCTNDCACRLIVHTFQVACQELIRESPIIVTHNQQMISG